MGKLFSEFNPEKIREIKTHPYYEGVVDAILARAEENLRTDPPRILFSQIHLFETTGNRTVFQKVFVEYESRLRNLFLAYLFTEDERYIEPLSDILWNICDMETWSIPAHVREQLTPAERRRNLDLTSTILGYRIAELLYYIGNKLPDLVRRRAEHEVRERVIESYRDNRDFWWMKTTNNWAAVCIGATLATYVYLASREETDAQLDRMIETAECYLRGFDDDGCCKEGYGYWNYGFSYFCLFADLLRSYTDGERDLFRIPKVHAIALFQQNASINEKETVSFSDGGTIFSPSTWLSHFLKHEFPDIEIPSLACTRDSSAPLRYYFWTRPEYASSEMHPVSHIYTDNQWFIHRAETYSIACKAGHNNEPHNHNDIGSFVLSKNGHTTFTDPGGGEYTRQYFSSERYSILACSSRGHSVPIINGTYQEAGSARARVYTAREDEYAFSMEQAYRVEGLQELTRRVRCLSDRVVLTDQYRFSEKPASVVERFVSLQEITLGDGYALCGDTRITFDPASVTASLTSEELKRASCTSTVYMLDLAVKSPSESFAVSVELA